MRLLIITLTLFSSLVMASPSSGGDDNDEAERSHGLKAQVQALEAEIAALRQQIIDIQLIPGPQGPQGPQGIPGPVGPAGPAGTGGLNLAGKSCPDNYFINGFLGTDYLRCSSPGSANGILVSLRNTVIPVPDIFSVTLSSQLSLSQRAVNSMITLGGLTDADCSAIAPAYISCIDMYTALFDGLGMGTIFINTYTVTGQSQANTLVKIYPTADCTQAVIPDVRAMLDNYIATNGPPALLTQVAGSIGITVTEYLNLIDTVGLISIATGPAEFPVTSTDGSFAFDVQYANLVITNQVSATARIVDGNFMTAESVCSVPAAVQ